MSNAASVPKLKEVFQETVGSKGSWKHLSNNGKIDLQGPLSYQCLLRIGFNKEDIQDLGYFKFTETTWNQQEIFITRTGYTGELGFEILASQDTIRKLWEKLYLDKEAQPAGLGARETLRLEMGYPLAGQDFTTQSYVHDVAPSKFLRVPLRVEKPQWKAISFMFKERAIPRSQMPILSEETDQEVGLITSGGISPSLQYSIGLGYIQFDCQDPLYIQIRKKKIALELAPIPFLKETSIRQELIETH